MTDRRRFFPAKGAQTVPGATAQVQVQLQPPGGAPAAPAALPDIAGPALLPEWRYMVGTVWEIYNSMWGDPTLVGTTSEPPADYYYIDDEGFYHVDAYTLYRKVEQNSIAHGSGYVLPAAQWSKDGRMTRCWVNLGEIKRPLRFRAVLLGRAMSDVKWTVNLDTPALPSNWSRELGELWPGGVDVEDEGHSLLIRVHPGKAGGGGQGSWTAALTLTASAGGKEVGALTLHLGWRVKPPATALQGDLYDLSGWEGWKPSDDQENIT